MINYAGVHIVSIRKKISPAQNRVQSKTACMLVEFCLEIISNVFCPTCFSESESAPSIHEAWTKPRPLCRNRRVGGPDINWLIQTLNETLVLHGPSKWVCFNCTSFRWTSGSHNLGVHVMVRKHISYDQLPKLPVIMISTSGPHKILDGNGWTSTTEI